MVVLGCSNNYKNNNDYHNNNWSLGIVDGVTLPTTAVD